MGQSDWISGTWQRAWGDSARTFWIPYRVDLDCGTTPSDWFVIVRSQGVLTFSYRGRGRGREEVIPVVELQKIRDLRLMGITAMCRTRMSQSMMQWFKWSKP